MSTGNGHRDPTLPVLRESQIWSRAVIEDIQMKAQLGRYRMQGFSTHRRVPTFDDLTFVPCTLSRVPLEGYRERCETKTVLGTRFAKKPVELKVPVTIAGMSYGALSKTAKTALGRAAARLGISTTTGDGGMLKEEREATRTMVYQVLPSRYGFDPDHLKMAEAIEIVIGQGAKPGTGGVLLGSKVSAVIAEQRTLPVGVDQRSPVRHPDFIGPDDLQIKIEELREATDWEKPIYVKLGASRVADDVKLAVKAGADVLVIDGMEGATGASPDVLLDHTGIPTMSGLCEAIRALEDMKALGQVQVIVSGGIKNGVDAAKALALGADAVSIGTAALIALNCNAPLFIEDYHRLGVEPGACHHCHTGRCPVGITTQDPELEKRLILDEASDRVFNFIQSMVMEMQMFARACGKSDVHHLEPEDMRALTLEASMITGIPLAGTDWILTPDAIADRVAARLEQRQRHPAHAAR
ncbi:MAG TPA: FMN-binding glutamate synthase family protein [Candidatus Limnocylindrales bacterium]|nr:FMN-binding glutamate synthase family protein [Candidatus Limnocylindrales bacterium]